MIFARKMLKFFIIIVRKIFFPNFRGHVSPVLRAPRLLRLCRTVNCCWYDETEIPGRAEWAAPTDSNWWAVGSWWRRSVLRGSSVLSVDSRCCWPSRWRPSSRGDCRWTGPDTSSWSDARRTASCWRRSRNRPGWWPCAVDWVGQRSHRPYETSGRERSTST